MKQKDLIQLEKIVKITEEIYDTYEKLIFLDANNTKNTDDYKELVIYLFLKVNEEKKLYDYFATDISKSEKAVRFLTKGIVLSLPTQAIAAISQDKTECIKIRVLSHFKDIILGEPENFIKDLDKVFFEIIDGVDDGIDYLYEILPVLENEIYIRLADFTECSSSLEKNEIEKGSLTAVKYHLSFLCLKLEELYLSHNFENLPKTFDEDIDIDFDSVPLEVKEDINDDQGFNVAMDAIDEMTEYCDNDLLDINVKVAFVTLVNLLKTGLLFLSKDGYEDLKEETDKRFNDENLGDNRNIKKLVYSIFDNAEFAYQYVNKDLNHGKEKTND